MKHQILNKYLFLALFLTLAACGGNKNDEGVSESEQAANDSKTVPVEITVITEQIIEATVPFTGVLEPYRSVDIIAEISGKVQSINKKLGQNISTQDVLAVIDDKVPFNQFQQARAQKLSADNNLKIAQLNLESDQILFENKDISKIAYETSNLTVKTAEANQLAAIANLSLLEKNYYNTQIKSPINGVISRKNIELGTMVNIGTPIYRVVDLSKLKIEIGISQDLISFVKVGSSANIIIAALIDQSYNGVIKFISPQADVQTGTFNAEIHVPNTPNREIRAGMTASIKLTISNKGKQLAVPNFAIVTKNTDKYIYKVTNNSAELTKIEVGQTLGNTTIVKSGLAAGDSVVVVGMKNLGENTAVYIDTSN